MKRLCTIVFSHVLVFLWTISVQAESPRIRLESARLHFVVFEEVDEVALRQSRNPLRTLTNRPWPLGGRTVVYPGLQLLAFIDDEQGMGRRVPLVLSFDQFYQRRSSAQFRRLWRSSLRSYVNESTIRSGEGGLMRLDLPVNLPTFLGGGTPVIQIIGNQRIEMDMTSDWEEGSTSTATNRISRVPNVSMQQTQSFIVTGTIGEKVDVNIKQSSEAFTDLENNLSLRYEDVYDDGREGNGIIRSFEAGNVSLNLKNTEFTGYTQEHTGLFGVKLISQFGDFHLTAIASQEKGEGQSATFQAGSKGNLRVIRDLDFRRRTYYFIDQRYRENFSRRDGNGSHVIAEESVTAIQVFVSGGLTATNQGKLVNADAYPDPPVYDDAGRTISPGSDAGEIVQHKFRFLESDEFYVNELFGYIVLNTPLQEGDVLAVYYETTNQGGEIRKYGRLDEDFLQLRLLKRQQETGPDVPDDPSRWGTWQYEWRNVYYLGKTDIDPESFELKIFRLESEGEHSEVDEDGIPFIRLLGLDRRGVDPGSAPDGLVDVDYALIDFRRGELIFPDQYPFAPVLTKVTAGSLAYPNSQGGGLPDETPELYTHTNALINSQFSTLHKYYIEVEYKDRLAQYSLGRSNIIEGSEIVRLNGQQLQRGVDYIILYEVGQIRFTNEEALSPDAEVTVQFQFAPFFKPVANTLLGLQGEYMFNERSWVKGTVLYRSDKSLEQKSRIGRETGRYLTWDIDTRLSFEPAFLTSFMEFISPADLGDAESFLRIEAELAQSVPNPNVLGDGFIDDFEGSKTETDLGVRRSGWRPASPPVDRTHDQRGRMSWYNPLGQVDVREIYPTRQVTGRDQLQHVLILEFDPRERDLRWGGQPMDTVSEISWSDNNPGDVEQRWAGLMRPLAGANADQTRSRFIEVWVNGNRGELHIDLGVISEDVNGNGILDTEDDRSDGFGNNLLEPEEDTGLDGLKDEDEPGYDPSTNPDPNGDNFAFEGTIGGSLSLDQVDYSRINGPENSASDPDQNRRPDTEDLDQSGYLERRNEYFKYLIDLSPDHDDTVFVAGGDMDRANWGNADSWRMYRIPLNTGSTAPDSLGGGPSEGGFETPAITEGEGMETGTPSANGAFDGTVGTPSFARIEAVRLWITKVSDPVTMRIASINIVGNQWEEDIRGSIFDSDGYPVSPETLSLYGETFNVAVKNTYDNPGDYMSPPGAIIEYDRVTGLENKEQSLTLSYTNLQPHHSAQAYRTLFTEQDYTLYNSLRLYVHGSNDLEVDKSPVFFIRFGSGDSDYYEYRAHVLPGWNEQNHLEVVFNDLTILKSETETARKTATTLDSTHTVTLSDGKERPVLFEEGPPENGLWQAIVTLEGGREYRVLGSPALARIRRITVGIHNPHDEALPSGELWLDELRAADVRRDRGLAGRLSVDADLAGVFSLFGTVHGSDSHFRRIGGAESGSRSTAMNLSTLLNLGRMMPNDWGIVMPFRFRWRNDLNLPRLQVGSDIILLRKEQREAQRTESRDHSFSASFSKRIGSTNPLVAWTLERFRVNFTSTGNFRHSVTRIDTSGTYRARLFYDLTPRSRISWPIFKWSKLPGFLSAITFNPLPRRFELSSEINRRKLNYLNRRSPGTGSSGGGETGPADGSRGERFVRYLSRSVRAEMEPFRTVRLNYNMDVTNDMKADSTIALTRFDFGPETSYRQNLGVDFRPEITSWFRPSYNFITSYGENRNPLLQTTGVSPNARSITFSNRQGIRMNINMVRMVSNVFGGPSQGSTEDESGGFSDNIVGRLGSFLGMFTPIVLNFTDERNQRFINAISRPSFKDRLGLTDHISVPFDTLSADGGGTGIQQNRETETDRSSFILSAGIRFLGTTLSFRPTWISSHNRTSNSNTMQNNVTWPEMTLRWNPNPRNMGSLGRLFRRLEILSGFSRHQGKVTDLRLVGNADLQEAAINRTTTTSLSPLIGFVFDMESGLVVRGNFNTSDVLRRFGRNQTNQQQQDRSLTFSVDYRLRPGFRVFGRRTSGDVNTRLQFTRETRRMLHSRGGGDYQPNNGQNQNRFQLTTDYRFSRYVRGGIKLELTNSQNVITQQKRLHRGGGLWTELLFN
ncbi:MAG: cell surface protein SprA [Gemmatimonadetes bacterium]|nr:cell surface protein SprA [Gemmatimonadota bacterium]